MIERIAVPHIFLCHVVPKASVAGGLSSIRSDGSSGCDAAKTMSSGTTSHWVVPVANVLSVVGLLPLPPWEQPAIINVDSSAGNKIDALKLNSI